MSKVSRFTYPGVALVAVALASSPVLADGNTVYLSQTGDRNTISVDQSRASNSVVRGTGQARGGSGNAAAQIGDGNAATIDVVGDGGDVRLLQRDDGNRANITIETLAGALVPSSVSVMQDGPGNESLVDIRGRNSTGSVSQDGRDNYARLTVAGSNASGTVRQIGNRNNFGFEVGSGTNVNFQQIGNGFNSSTPFSVISNSAREIRITQRNGTFGGRVDNDVFVNGELYVPELPADLQSKQ